DSFICRGGGCTVSTSHRGDSERNKRLSDAIEEYNSRVGSGEEIDRERFVAEHPEAADGLEIFFKMEGLPPSSGHSVSQPAASSPSPPVSRLGKYKLLKEIGRGAMGIVYQAEQLDLGRIVAVKILQSGRFASQEEIGRFLGDARKAGGLQHPNIIRVH